jgi:hypothetical protein
MHHTFRRDETMIFAEDAARLGVEGSFVTLRRHTVALCTLAAICGFLAAPVAARACPQPNRDALVTEPHQPEYPRSAKTLGPLSVEIEVAVDPSGNIAGGSRLQEFGESGGR